MVRRTPAASAAMLAAVLLLSACTGVPAVDEETPHSDAGSEQPTPSVTPPAEDVPAAPSCLEIDTTEPTVVLPRAAGKLVFGG